MIFIKNVTVLNVSSSSKISIKFKVKINLRCVLFLSSGL